MARPVRCVDGEISLTTAFAIHDGAPLQQVLSPILRQVTEVPGVMYAAVYLIDDPAARLTLRASHGLTAQYLDFMSTVPLYLASGTAISGPPSVRAVLTGTTTIVRDMINEPGVETWQPVVRDHGFQGICAFPLQDSTHRSVGSLTVYLASVDALASADICRVDRVASVVSAIVALVLSRDTAGQFALAQRAEIDQLASRIDELETAITVQCDALALAVTEPGLEPILQLFADGLDMDITLIDQKGGAVSAGAPLSRPMYRRAIAGRDSQPLTLQASARTTNDLAPTARLALDAACALAELELARMTRDADIEARLTLDLIADLLSPAAMRHDAAVIGRARALGHRPNQPHDVVLIIPVQDESKGTLQVQRVRSRIINETTKLEPRPVVGSLGSTVIVLSPVADLTVGVCGDTRTLVDRLIRVVPQSFRVLIGPRADSLTDAHRVLEAASRAAQLLTADSPSVTDMTNLGLHGLLLESGTADSLRNFADRTLASLTRHDENRDGSLIDTLRVWLAADMSASATARQLVVHANTINYRLRRIGELSGLLPSRPIDLLQLQLALTVTELAGRFEVPHPK